MEVIKGDLVHVHGGRYGLVRSTYDYTDSQGWDCQRIEVWFFAENEITMIGVGSVVSVICHTDYEV